MALSDEVTAARTHARSSRPLARASRCETRSGAITVKVRGVETNWALMALETVAAPDEGPPHHVHPDAGELWYVVEGSFRFRVDDDVRQASAE